MKVRIHSDATAAIGKRRRRGLGKIRHLDVADFWAQDKVRSGNIELCKMLSAKHPADITTKYIEKPFLENMLLKMNMHVMEGRAAFAPTTAAKS